MASPAQPSGAPPLPAPLKRRVPTFSRRNPLVSTVGTTSTQVFDAYPDRIMWLAVNLSANAGHIGFDEEVSSSRGIPVAANGGSITLLYREDGDLVTLPVFAVNAVAPGTWYFVDVIADSLEAWLQFLAGG